VGTVTPNEAGRCRQAHPDDSTNTIAVNTDRLHTRPRPPPWRRTFAGGISGSITAHRFGLTSRAESCSMTSPRPDSLPCSGHDAVRIQESWRGAASIGRGSWRADSAR
jgi:hypothetical protein